MTETNGESASLPKATIMVVEDEWVVARDVQDQLRAAGFEVGEPVANAEDALGLAARQRPDLMLIDIGLADGTDGLVLAERIRRAVNPPQVVMLTGREEPAFMMRACAAGAAGYVVKPFQPSQLLGAVLVGLERGRQERTEREERRQAATSLQAIAADLVKREEGGEPRTNLMAQLSAREQHIVRLLAEHHRPRSVATELGISYHTVRNHLRRIFRKLNVSSQSALLRVLKDR
ncbi:MAG: DNA-binding response regulator [Vicinamibacterales bacterium]